MKNERNKTLGFLIKKYRRKNKITQLELAKKITRSESLIRKYEKGERTISKDAIKDINKILNIDLEFECSKILTAKEDAKRLKILNTSKERFENMIARKQLCNSIWMAVDKACSEVYGINEKYREIDSNDLKSPSFEDYKNLQIEIERVTKEVVIPFYEQLNLRKITEIERNKIIIKIVSYIVVEICQMDKNLNNSMNSIL